MRTATGVPSALLYVSVFVDMPQVSGCLLFPGSKKITNFQNFVSFFVNIYVIDYVIK